MGSLVINLQPELYPDQKTAIYDPRRYVFIEASTKAGKTLGCLNWMVHETCLFSNGANSWWVAPVYRQAKMAYDRMKRGLAPYKEYGFHFKESDLSITYPNGAICSFKSGDDPDNLYGDDVVRVVIDEASRVKEASWHAIRSTLTATKGKARIIGNVKGRKNWFYVLSRKAQAGADDMAYFILTAYDAAKNGVIDYKEIEDAKAMLPEEVFNELYLAIPSADGGNPFNVDYIERCIAPTTSNEPIVYGLDLAKYNDYTVLIGLDKSGHVCFYERWKAAWEQTVQKVKDVVSNVQVYADATGVGDPIVERLRSEGCCIEDVVYTSMKKQQLMEGLALAIQKEEIHYPQGRIVDELMSFEYEITRKSVKYSAPEGLFDDCVNALALANSGLIHRTTSPNTGDIIPEGIIRESVIGWDANSSLSLKGFNDAYADQDGFLRIALKDWM